MTEQEVIHRLQDDMVERAEGLVRKLSLRKGEGSKSGKNQASRALEVAQSAGSLSVFINWLRYQAGREKNEKKGDFWTKSIDTKRANQPDRYLAKEMSDELVWLRQEILNRLAADDKLKQDRVTMRATTRFLGYFRRALIGADYLDEIMLN